MGAEVLDPEGERGEAEREEGEAEGTQEAKMVALVKEGGEAMRKKETWYIHLRPPCADPWRPVQGSRVTIPGYEEFELFMHGERRSWSVTDARTGCYIVLYGSTQKDAIAVAQQKLDSKGGLEKYQEAIARKEQKDGLSPRYEEGWTDRGTFPIKFDPHLELFPAERKEALSRMARYGELNESTDGWLWTPRQSQKDPERRIAREGFIIIKRTEGR